MAEHTLGPWQWNADFYDVRNSKDDCSIAVVLLTPDEDEAQANGRLIAGAPELLEALKKCVAHIREMTHGFDDPEDEAPELAAIDALIANAEGREP